MLADQVVLTLFDSPVSSGTMRSSWLDVNAESPSTESKAHRKREGTHGVSRQASGVPSVVTGELASQVGGGLACRWWCSEDRDQ